MLKFKKKKMRMRFINASIVMESNYYAEYVKVKESLMKTQGLLN